MSEFAKPSFDEATKTITIPEVDKVVHTINGVPVTGDVKINRTTTVRISAAQGYKLAKGVQTDYKFVVSKDEPKVAEKSVEDQPNPAPPVEGLTAGSDPQAPGQDSGRRVSGGSFPR